MTGVFSFLFHMNFFLGVAATIVSYMKNAQEKASSSNTRLNDCFIFVLGVVETGVYTELAVSAVVVCGAAAPAGCAMPRPMSGEVAL